MMNSVRQKEAVNRLARDEMSGAFNAMIDRETLQLIYKPTSFGEEIDSKNYKWVQFGDDHDCRYSPFNKSQFKDFFL